MAGASPQRSIDDAREWIAQLESRLTIAHHRRILKAALADIWTAMDQIRSSAIRRLRKDDRQRAADFKKWWDARLAELKTSDPGLNWAWQVRNTTQHEGADGAIYDVAVVFDRVEMEAQGLMETMLQFNITIDEEGNAWCNGEPVNETGDVPGAPYFVQRTALGVDMPAMYGPNDVVHPLRDACDSAEVILREVAENWA